MIVLSRLLLLILLLLSSACGGSSEVLEAERQRLAAEREKSAALQAKVTELEARVRDLESEKERLQAVVHRLEQERKQAQAERNRLLAKLDELGGMGSPGGEDTSPIPFEDVEEGVYGYAEIADLARLGVFEETTGRFDPGRPITRGEFVTWLVRANNLYFGKDSARHISLASVPEGGRRPPEGERQPPGGRLPQRFEDVPPGHPCYPVVQGLVQAGYEVGSGDQTFRPDENLTREQMLGIKVQFDQDLSKKKPATREAVQKVWEWEDVAAIDPRYLTALYWDGLADHKNVTRLYGNLSKFEPRRPVTRAEAAVCIWRIGDRGGRTAREALKERSQAPSPGNGVRPAGPAGTGRREG